MYFSCSDAPPSLGHIPNKIGSTDLKNLLYCSHDTYHVLQKPFNALSALNMDEMLYVYQSLVMHTIANFRYGTPQECVDDYTNTLGFIISEINPHNIRDKVKKHEGLIALRTNSEEASKYLNDKNFCNDVFKAVPMFNLLALDELSNGTAYNYSSDNAQLFGILPLSWFVSNLRSYSEGAFLESFIIHHKWYNRYQILNLYHNVKYYKRETLVRDIMPKLMRYFDNAERVLQLVDVTQPNHDDVSLTIPYILESRGLTLKDLVDVNGPIEEYTLYSVIQHLQHYQNTLMDRTLVLSNMSPHNVSSNPLE